MGSSGRWVAHVRDGQGDGAMTIVGVHGIGKYRYFQEAGSAAGAAEAMRAKWNAYLHTGLNGAAPYDGRSYLAEIAYYAHHLRQGDAEPIRDLDRMSPEHSLLMADWLAQLDLPRLDGVRAAAGESLTGLLRRLAEWAVDRFGPQLKDFAKNFVPEVAAYLAAPDAPARVRSRDTVAEVIRRRRPAVLIAHSLGSVVAYEALWAYPELRVELLITLGSPLGMPHVVFDRLLPPPLNGRGRRPPGVARWVNIADKDDIVAIPARLSDRFAGVDADELVDIDWIDFHTVGGYLGSGALNRHLKPYL
jgi:pimeloyl-ACP methyl ester carboxylesterase